MLHIIINQKKKKKLQEKKRENSIAFPALILILTLFFL